MAKQKDPMSGYKVFRRQLPTPDQWSGNYIDPDGGEAAEGRFQLLYGMRWKHTRAGVSGCHV